MEKEQKILVTLLIVTMFILIINARSMNAIVEVKKTDNGDTSKVIPKGIPKIYGAELSIGYDDVSPSDPYKADVTIEKLAQIDKSVELLGKDKDRYINILYTMYDGMSCEYCCGARSIIFENGQAACGCAHSFAMRGLAKYLISEHSEEFTDEEILEEIGKWKTLFFPTQMELKAGIFKEQGVEFNYINLASNKYRGVEQGKTAGAMVGGC